MPSFRQGKMLVFPASKKLYQLGTQWEQSFGLASLQRRLNFDNLLLQKR